MHLIPSPSSEGRLFLHLSRVFFPFPVEAAVTWLSSSGRHLGAPLLSRPSLFLGVASPFSSRGTASRVSSPVRFTLSDSRHPLACSLEFSPFGFSSAAPPSILPDPPPAIDAPSSCSTLFSDSHQCISMPPYPYGGALLPTLAGARPEVLACAARPSIYFSSPTFLPGRAYTCCGAASMPCARTGTFTLHIAT